jgi:glutamyl-tRNA reductase
MTSGLAVLAAHAELVPASERAALAASWAHALPAGAILLTTCHRVELYGEPGAIQRLSQLGPRVRQLRDIEAVRHLITVAVGRDSAIVGEDQVLHQLRSAVYETRARGAISRDLDRAIDLALRAGRRARSWLPARRPTLVDLGLQRVLADQDLTGKSVLVVGAGQMGGLAVARLTSLGARILVSSRSGDSANLVAARHGASSAPFDPGPDVLAKVSGIIVALSGPWEMSEHSQTALAQTDAWLIDLSSPPALDPGSLTRENRTVVTIDDFARSAAGSPSASTLRRLDDLIDETVDEYKKWTDATSRRTAAEALSERALSMRALELEQLWYRLPTLDDAQRAEVERMAEHLTERLLRDPLEQLSADRDGKQANAARELFRL